MSISRKENGGQERVHSPGTWPTAISSRSSRSQCFAVRSPLSHCYTAHAALTAVTPSAASTAHLVGPQRGTWLVSTYAFVPQSPCRRDHHASSSSRPAKSTILRSPDERARLPRCSLQIAETPATGSSLELAAPSAPPKWILTATSDETACCALRQGLGVPLHRLGWKGEDFSSLLSLAFLSSICYAGSTKLGALRTSIVKRDRPFLAHITREDGSSWAMMTYLNGRAARLC